MGVYLAVARQSFRRQSTYRAAMVAGIFTNAVFGVILASVLLAAFEGRREINGLDAAAAVTITFITQGLLLVTATFGWTELSDRVRTGDIATDLQRPVDVSLYWMAMFLGASAFAMVGRGVPPLLGGLIFELRVPSLIDAIVGFLLTVLGAAAVASRWWFLVSLGSFWFIGDVRGLLQMASGLQLFCSGSVVPLQFFPDALGELLRRTPFATMAQLPAEVFLGRQGALPVLGAQAVWVAVLHGCGFVVRGAGDRGHRPSHLPR